MNNIVDIYTDNILKEFCYYAKIIMGKYYISSIFNELVKEYIQIRYYNIYPAKQNNKTTINYYLNLKIKELIENNPDKIENITFMTDIFSYLVYLESDITAEEINKIEKELEELIKTKYNLNEEIEFSKKYREFKKTKKEFIKSFETDDFILSVKNTKTTRLYDTILNYNIEMPELYSKKAIDTVYNTGMISEDKLFVLYNLIGIKILKEIINYNYNDCYLVEFNTDLFNKNEKLNRLLKIIDNDITKEKICLKITYSKFIDNKEKVFNMINNGYNFALIKDENYKDEFKDLFKYIIDWGVMWVHFLDFYMKF